MGIFLEAFRAWQRRAKPEAAAPRVVPRFETNAPKVAVEYLSLYKYLEHRYASTVVLTFDQIELLLGFSLPALASSEAGWWTTVAAHPAHSTAWIGAGRSALPNLRARIVTFERQI